MEVSRRGGGPRSPRLLRSCLSGEIPYGILPKQTSNCFGTLVGACPVTGDRIFATGSDSVSKIVSRSCGCFCLISGHKIMV